MCLWCPPLYGSSLWFTVRNGRRQSLVLRSPHQLLIWRRIDKRKFAASHQWIECKFRFVFFLYVCCVCVSIVHAFLPRQWGLRLVVVLVAAQSELELYLQVCYYDNLPTSETHTHDLLYCYVRVITPGIVQPHINALASSKIKEIPTLDFGKRKSVIVCSFLRK